MNNDPQGQNIEIGDVPIDEAERRLNLCPECLQNDGYHDSWCENVMAVRDRAEPHGSPTT